MSASVCVGSSGDGGENWLYFFFLLSRGNSTQTDNLDEGKLSCQKHVDVQKRIELSISAKTTPKGMGYVI